MRSVQSWKVGMLLGLGLFAPVIGYGDVPTKLVVHGFYGWQEKYDINSSVGGTGLSQAFGAAIDFAKYFEVQARYSTPNYSQLDPYTLSFNLHYEIYENSGFFSIIQPFGNIGPGFGVYRSFYLNCDVGVQVSFLNFAVRFYHNSQNKFWPPFSSMGSYSGGMGASSYILSIGHSL